MRNKLIPWMTRGDKWLPLESIQTGCRLQSWEAKPIIWIYLSSCVASEDNHMWLFWQSYFIGDIFMMFYLESSWISAKAFGNMSALNVRHSLSLISTECNKCDNSENVRRIVFACAASFLAGCWGRSSNLFRTRKRLLGRQWVISVFCILFCEIE